MDQKQFFILNGYTLYIYSVDLKRDRHPTDHFALLFVTKIINYMQIIIVHYKQNKLQNKNEHFYNT